MIDKIYLNDTEDNKSFVIRIIDEDLIGDARRYHKRFIWKPNFTRWEFNWDSYECSCFKPENWLWRLCRPSFREYASLLIQ